MSYDCSCICHSHWRYFNFKYQHYDFTANKNYENARLDGYNTEIKSQVQSVIAILQAEYDKSQNGDLTEDEAKKEAAEIVRNMRYRDDGSGYFWIDDTDYNLIMHPILTDQEGNNRYDLQIRMASRSFRRS